MYVQNNNVIYFDSFEVEQIPKEIKKFIGNKNTKTNIFRIQAYDSIMCGYFCIGFVDFMLAKETLTEFTNLFSPNNFNNKIKYYFVAGIIERELMRKDLVIILFILTILTSH